MWKQRVSVSGGAIALLKRKNTLAGHFNFISLMPWKRDQRKHFPPFSIFKHWTQWVSGSVSPIFRVPLQIPSTGFLPSNSFFRVCPRREIIHQYLLSLSASCLLLRKLNFIFIFFLVLQNSSLAYIATTFFMSRGEDGAVKRFWQILYFDFYFWITFCEVYV